MDNRTVHALDVTITAEALTVVLSDGRTITTPLAWFPRLHHATPEQRLDFRLIGGGKGIHWPAVDEDLSVAGLLAGTPSMDVERVA